MFERITVYQDVPIDIGLLLETMLFYGKVTVVADREQHLRQLVHTFGFDHLNKLIDEDILDLQYTEEFNVVTTKDLPSGYSIHDSARISSPQHTFQSIIRKVCIEKAGKEGKGRRNAQRLSSKIEEFNYETSLNDAARRLFTSELTNEAVPRLLRHWIPEISEVSNLHFSAEKTEKGIIVSTNIDFEKANRIYHKRIPASHSSLSPAFILATLQSAEVALYFASRNVSEIATSAISSEIVSLRLSHLHNRCTKSTKERESFQDLIFEDHKTIRESYNSGSIEIDEILKAVYKARKFKIWLNGQSVDSDLVKNYFKEVTKDSALDKLPNKFTRWSLMTGAGVLTDLAITGGLGTAAGLSLSAMDAFFVDKFAKGWRPNQFVDGYLTSLIKKPNKS